jgi:hypothetical protein
MRLALKGAAIVAIVVVAAVVTVFAVVPADVPPEASPELTADEKALEFLSSVVGLNVTEYIWDVSKLPPGYDAESWAEHLASLAESNATYTYPPELCGIVKQETSSFDFIADGNTISVMSIFYNGQIKTIKINNLGGEYVYSEQPAPDILSQARTILQRYQAYAAQVYGTNNSYLEPMQNILNNITQLSPMNITVGNINFQVSESGDTTRIQWIYTENGVIMDRKRVELKFCNNDFLSFRDMWRVYSVGGFSVINSEEAYKIALAAAQNCELRIGYENGTTKIATLPDLSDAFYERYFNMLPYRNETSHLPSKIDRDPLTLYPYWQFYFYFNETIAGNSGVQVGIWGDTKEIIYCSGFGFYGTSDPTSEEDVTTDTSNDEYLTPLLPEEQTSEEQQQEQPALLDPLVLAAAVSLAAVLAISLSVVALRRKNQHKQQA